MIEVKMTLIQNQPTHSVTAEMHGPLDDVIAAAAKLGLHFVPVAGVEAPNDIPVEIVKAAAADIPVEIVKAAEPTKRTRKSKNEQPEMAVEQPAAVEPAQESTAEQAAAVSAPSYTVDDVRRALQDYVGRTDFATGTALVKSFGATRITELKAEDYAAFIEKAAA